MAAETKMNRLAAMAAGLLPPLVSLVAPACGRNAEVFDEYLVPSGLAH